MKRFLPGSERGFTLVELLVVISVIGILAVLSFLSLVTVNQGELSRNAALSIRNDLRLAQSAALSNELETSTNQPDCYYGIILNGNPAGGSFNITSYSTVRIQKQGGSCQGTLPTSCPNTTGNCGTKILSTTPFPSSVAVSTPLSSRLLLFTETSAAVQVVPVSGLPPATVVISIKESGTTLTVSLDSSGRIE